VIRIIKDWNFKQGMISIRHHWAFRDEDKDVYFRFILFDINFINAEYACTIGFTFCSFEISFDYYKIV